MTPRERMKKFLAREPVGRIPNGLGGCETAGLHNLAYEKLKRVLGVTDRKRRLYTFLTNAIFEPSVVATRVCTMCSPDGKERGRL